MELKIFVNNPWQENTIILFDETGEGVIIDCGCYGPMEQHGLVDFIVARGIKPVALLNTHLHIDHVFGNDFIREQYGLSPQASESDNYLIDDAVEYAERLGLSGIDQPPATGKYLQDGDIIKFGNSFLEAIAVPGHTPGGLCYYAKNDKLLIAGDVLFQESIGRSDLPGGNGTTLIRAIKEKLFTLPEDVRVIPGHGPETTIGHEKRHNPFFKY